MEDRRPVITYHAEDFSTDETAIDISIDRPFNGFFGVRMVMPTPTGSDVEQQAKILDWVKRRVGQQVGDAVNVLTFHAV